MSQAPSLCKQITPVPSCPQKHIVFLISSRCYPRRQVARLILTSKKLKQHSTHGWERSSADPLRWCVFVAPVCRPILSDSRYQEVYECESPLGISLTYPLASYQQLRGIVDYTAAGFLLDDILQVSFRCSFLIRLENLHSDHDRGPSEGVAALTQLWMETLRDGSEVKSVQHPVIEMMRRLVDLFASCLFVMKPFPIQ